MVEVISLLCDNYDKHMKPTTARSPQANVILERAHQTIGNIICTFQLDKTELDMENPWEGILSAVIFAMKITVHTGQLAINKKYKQELACKNNTRKNKNA